jgi:glycosyltransferase involved in cell wall biosynthesis
MARHRCPEDREMSRTMAKTTVTIALCVHNEASRIQTALTSLVRQTDENWECVVVDDGSTDGTSNLVDQLKEPRIRVERWSTNMGKAFALQRAAELARGDYFLELDGDDWLAENAVEEFRQAGSDLHEEVGLLTSRYHLWRLSRRGHLNYRGVHEHTPIHLDEDFARVPMPRCFRISAIRCLGGWHWPGEHPSAKPLFEDVTMTARLLRRYQIAMLPTALYHRVLRSDSVSQSHRHRYSEWFRAAQSSTPEDLCVPAYEPLPYAGMRT